MNEKLKQYLQQENLVPPSHPIPLHGDERLKQLEIEDIAPEWEMVSDVFDDFIACHEGFSLQYLYEHGRGAELKAHTADFFFHFLMEQNDLEKSPLELFKEVISPEFLHSLPVYEHEQFARLLISTPYPTANDGLDYSSEVEYGLRSYVTRHTMSIDEEEELETWLLDSLSLDDIAIETITAERRYWHIELEREIEEILEEPTDDAYNFEAFLQTYQHDPLRAIGYFQQLPIIVQKKYMPSIIRSLTELDEITAAQRVVDTFADTLAKNTQLKPQEQQYCISQLLSSYIECVNPRGLMTTMKKINAEGLTVLCSYLGLSEKEFSNVMLYRYGANIDNFKSNVSSSSFYNFLKGINIQEKSFTKNPFYRQLLLTKMYLYPNINDVTDRANPFLTEIEFVKELTINFGMSNNMPFFLRWLGLVNKVAGAKGVADIYTELLYLANKLDRDEDAFEDDDDEYDSI